MAVAHGSANRRPARAAAAGGIRHGDPGAGGGDRPVGGRIHAPANHTLQRTADRRRRPCLSGPSLPGRASQWPRGTRDPCVARDVLGYRHARRVPDHPRPDPVRRGEPGDGFLRAGPAQRVRRDLPTPPPGTPPDPCRLAAGRRAGSGAVRTALAHPPGRGRRRHRLADRGVGRDAHARGHPSRRLGVPRATAGLAPGSRGARRRLLARLRGGLGAGAGGVRPGAGGGGDGGTGRGPDPARRSRSGGDPHGALHPRFRGRRRGARYGDAHGSVARAAAGREPERGEPGAGAHCRTRRRDRGADRPGSTPWTDLRPAFRRSPGAGTHGGHHRHRRRRLGARLGGRPGGGRRVAVLGGPRDVAAGRGRGAGARRGRERGRELHPRPEGHPRAGRDAGGRVGQTIAGGDGARDLAAAGNRARRLARATGGGRPAGAGPAGLRPRAGELRRRPGTHCIALPRPGGHRPGADHRGTAGAPPQAGA